MLEICIYHIYNTEIRKFLEGLRGKASTMLHEVKWKKTDAFHQPPAYEAYKAVSQVIRE